MLWETERQREEREGEGGQTRTASPPGLQGGTDVSLFSLQATEAQPSTATDRVNRLEKNEKNGKLNIGFVSSVIKAPWNWLDAAKSLPSGVFHLKCKTMSWHSLLINPLN